MGKISEEDRIGEFKNLKENLDAIDIVSDIIGKKGPLEQSILMIMLPSDEEGLWEGEDYPEDGHLAFAYLMQREEDNPITQYLMLYTEILVDVSDVEEIKILRLINDMNRTLLNGCFFYAKEAQDERPMVHLKMMVGGDTEEFINEAVAGESIIDMGIAYDRMKEALLALKEQ